MKSSFFQTETIDCSWVKWQKLFHDHQNVQFIDNWKRIRHFKRINVDIKTDPMICAKLSGDICVSGHASGLICIWSLKSQELIDIVDNLHNDQITDIALNDAYHVSPYVLIKADDSVCANHHFFISASLNGKVYARGLALSQNNEVTNKLEVVSESLELADHNCPHVQIGVFGRLLTIFSRENSISVWDIEVPPHFEKSAKKLPRFLPLHHLKGPDSFLFMGKLWSNSFYPWIKKVIVMARSGKCLTMQNVESNDRSMTWTWIPIRGSNAEMTLIIPTTRWIFWRFSAFIRPPAFSKVMFAQLRAPAFELLFHTHVGKWPKNPLFYQQTWISSLVECRSSFSRQNSQDHQATERRLEKVFGFEWQCKH